MIYFPRAILDTVLIMVLIYSSYTCCRAASLKYRNSEIRLYCNVILVVVIGPWVTVQGTVKAAPAGETKVMEQGCPGRSFHLRKCAKSRSAGV